MVWLVSFVASLLTTNNALPVGDLALLHVIVLSSSLDIADGVGTCTTGIIEGQSHPVELMESMEELHRS